MKKVVAAYPSQKIHVILDNAFTHLSKEIESGSPSRGGESCSTSLPRERRG